MPSTERKPLSRRVQRNWDEATKQRALELYKSSGVTVAAKATGVPRQSITSWAKQAGVIATYTSGQAARIEVQRQRWQEKQVEVAINWGEVAELGTARVIEALRDGRMSPRDAAWAAAVATDKARLIDGDATNRVELVGWPAAAAAWEQLKAMQRKDGDDTGIGESIDLPDCQQRELPAGGSDDVFAADALVIDAEVVEG